MFIYLELLSNLNFVQWLHNLSYEENKNKNACLVFLTTTFKKYASNKCHHHTSCPRQFTAKKHGKLWTTDYLVFGPPTDDVQSMDHRRLWGQSVYTTDKIVSLATTDVLPLHSGRFLYASNAVCTRSGY